MKKRISRIICTLLCCAPIAISAQTSEKITSPVNLYKEGKELSRKNYAAAIPALKAFVKQKPTASLLQDAEYMLVSSAYELKDKNRIELLRKYLDCYPDTPYANRIYSLLASCYFYEGKYDEPWHSLILHGSIYWEMRSATTAPTTGNLLHED